MRYIFVIIILLTFAVGLFFRVWRISEVPVSLFGDEIDVGLQANSILQTGKDYYGQNLPVMFHSFSEYRLPMQIYLDVPFIKIFGLNPIGVRGPAIFTGILSIISLYFLAREIFDTKIALFASLLMTFSPWHFMFSRQANDAGILLPFVLLAFLFFLKGLKKDSYLYLSALFFILGIYTYAIATLFVPLFLLALFLIFRKEIYGIGLKKISLICFFGMLLLLPYLMLYINGIAGRRFSSISQSDKSSAVLEVEGIRRWSNSALTRFFYNKFTIPGEKVLKNYINAYSTSFLFIKGDPNPRQSIGRIGEMYYFDFPLIFIAIGFVTVAFQKTKKRKFILAIFAWLLLSPIPSALTKDGGDHASRLILMLPPLLMLSALGFGYVADTLRKKYAVFVLPVLFIVIGLNIGYFIHNYFAIWPNISWRYWQYGYEQVFKYTKSIDNNFERVIVNNTYEPSLPRFLFWYSYDMKRFQREFNGDIMKKEAIPQLNGFSLGDKYFFGDLQKPLETLAKPGDLVIASGEKDITNPLIFEDSDLYLLKVIYSPDNYPLFYVFTNKNSKVDFLEL